MNNKYAQTLPDIPNFGYFCPSFLISLNMTLLKIHETVITHIVVSLKT